MNRLFLLSLFFIVISYQSLPAQYLMGIATRWSDSFKEWILFTDDENVEGTLNMRWLVKDDWTEWEYDLDEQFGSIETKFKDMSNHWEVRGDNRVITMRTLWRNNFKEWRITDNDIQLTFKCRYSNVSDEWEIVDDKYGFFGVYTVFEGDPREWEIVDELDDSIPFQMKIGMVFLAVYHSRARKRR